MSDDEIGAMIALVAIIGLGWVLPITLGIQAANRKGYSSNWMWFGLYPLSGWIACLILCCLPARRQCTSCGGFVDVRFRICPYCHHRMHPEHALSMPGERY